MAFSGAYEAVVPDSEEPQEVEETSAAEEWAKYGMAAGYVSAGGMQVVIGALVGYFGGRWLDRKLGWDSILALLLAFVGFTAGVYQMYRTLQLLQRNNRKKDEERARGKHTS